MTDRHAWLLGAMWLGWAAYAYPRYRQHVSALVPALGRDLRA